MVSKQSIQLLQKVEPSSTVARQVVKRECYTLQPTCNLSRNVIVIQIAKKLRGVTLTVELDSTFCKDCRDFSETIAACILRLHSLATYNGFLF